MHKNTQGIQQVVNLEIPSSKPVLYIAAVVIIIAIIVILVLCKKSDDASNSFFSPTFVAAHSEIPTVTKWRKHSDYQTIYEQFHQQNVKLKREDAKAMCDVVNKGYNRLVVLDLHCQSLAHAKFLVSE